MPVAPSIHCGGRLLTFHQPVVMGILNITPDSFSDGGKWDSTPAILQHAAFLLENGCTILDIGAQSTRPGATPISADEEICRLGKIISQLRQNFAEVYLSIDTYYGAVAEYALQEGADIINDISGGYFDPEILTVAAKYRAPYILTHGNRSYTTLHATIKFKNIVAEVNSDLLKRAEELRQLGITDIILDPGFGFGKSIDDQHTLLHGIESIGLGLYPVLAGISRKSFLYKAVGKSPHTIEQEMYEAHTILLQKGVHIVRVHDPLPIKNILQARNDW